MKIELPTKYVEQGIDTLEKLFEYINYLEDVREDYAYLKDKLKGLVTEVETLLYWGITHKMKGRLKWTKKA